MAHEGKQDSQKTHAGRLRSLNSALSPPSSFSIRHKRVRTTTKKEHGERAQKGWNTFAEAQRTARKGILSLTSSSLRALITLNSVSIQPTRRKQTKHKAAHQRAQCMRDTAMQAITACNAQGQAQILTGLLRPRLRWPGRTCHPSRSACEQACFAWARSPAACTSLTRRCRHILGGPRLIRPTPSKCSSLLSLLLANKLIGEAVFFSL